ncbi:IgGFc-binding protein-like [Lytechinus pictus]|uniref:IgGFc-binding protein-like n=1 Tax=Lytechinus pictus TaxID=7653 RepID=UPI0030BA0C96
MTDASTTTAASTLAATTDTTTDLAQTSIAGTTTEDATTSNIVTTDATEIITVIVTSAITMGASTLAATTTSTSTTADPDVVESSSGTDFSFAFPANALQSANTNNSLIFTTTSSSTVSVEVTGDMFHSTFTVDSSEEYVLSIEGIPLSVGQGVQSSTVTIVASDKIAVRGRSVDGISIEEFTAISNTGLGTEYVIASYPPLATGDYHSEFTLTTGDASTTHATIHFSQDVEYEGDVYNSNNPLELDLTSHQTVQFQSLTDLTGSFVSTTEPVSVVSGDSCARIPVDVEFCNYLVEQLPPVERWGKTVVFSSFRGRTSGTIIRIIVSHSGANVQVRSGVLSTRSFSPSSSGFLDVDIGLNTDPIAIHADNPILVLMYQKSVYTDDAGDSSMTIVPAVEQWTSGEVSFFVVDQQSTEAHDYISVTIETDNDQGLVIDSISLGALSSSSVEVLRHAGYTVFRVEIDPGYHTLRHVDEDVKFSVIVYGDDVYNSYAYPSRFELPVTS